MKTTIIKTRPDRWLWKNSNHYFHFTAESLTIADFSKAPPTVQFTTAANITFPDQGWEKISIKQFNELIDAL